LSGLSPGKWEKASPDYPLDAILYKLSGENGARGFA